MIDFNVTPDLFRAATGREPKDDDLERCNCNLAGRLGHEHCGWSVTLNRPAFEVPQEVLKKETRP